MGLACWKELAQHVLHVEHEQGEEVVTEDEEATFMMEMEPHLKRHIYEKDHWDDAIVGFRETERKIFNASNTPLVERIK